MKLKAELNYVLESMKKLDRERVIAHIHQVKLSKNYNVFETRIANNILRASVPADIICGWYNKYNCNDTHITTLAIKACKELNFL